MKVIKFGGTSVGSIENLNKVASIVAGLKKPGEPLLVVCSAFGGVTDELIRAADLACARDASFSGVVDGLRRRHLEVISGLIPDNAAATEHVDKSFEKISSLLNGVNLLGQLPEHTLAHLTSFGERLSCFLIAAMLNDKGHKADYVNATKLIRTNSDYVNGRVFFEETNAAIADLFRDYTGTAIVTGFIGADEKGHITTLGRGGSDFTASILAAALGAEEIQIWTDVNGVLTADPRKVDQAFTIPSLSYLEAMELSHFGAKVIYPPTIQPALSKDIPLVIKNTFNPAHPGTRISRESEDDGNVIKGISSISRVTLLRFEGSGLVGVIGMAARLFSTLSRARVNIIFLTQGSSEHSICFGVMPNDAWKAKQAVEEDFHLEMRSGFIQPLIVEENKSIIAVIGERMSRKPGIAAKMFRALGKNGINISAIAQGSSELNITAVIDQVHEAKALNALHEIFFRSDLNSINVFLVGPSGLIGGTLLKQLSRQLDFLKREKLIEINLVGLINSSTMLIDTAGIAPDRWEGELAARGKEASLQEFIDRIIGLDFANSALVDCSASQDVVTHYEHLLSKSVSVVTPNKIANTLSQAKYNKLRDLARSSGASFLYETNVGAGLPVISTLHALLDSGDNMLRIEAVLSGSLSFIFNTFRGDRKFSEVVAEARERGYTEPDPRDDLSGLDVARKALILSREIGGELELEDIAVTNLVPEAGRSGSVDDFFAVLKAADAEFESLKQKAESEGKALRYLACIEPSGVRIELRSVGADHPFYQLSGSDNMIVFTTERYRDNPLVVKGPGAGAEVTAAGVFAEIIRMGSSMTN